MLPSKSFFIFGLVWAGLLAGCASAPVAHFERDPQADLAAYRTFSFFEAGEPGASNTTDSRVREATRKQLQHLGYVYVEGDGELRVNVLISRPEDREPLSVPLAVGRFAYRGWVPHAIEARNYREGTLTIDLVDAGRNSMVWRGVANSSIKTTETNENGGAIDAAVRRLFVAFPGSAAG